MVEVNSEIHAHTMQAAIAKIDQRAGCPAPTSSTKLTTTSDGIYSIVRMYHKNLVGKLLSASELVTEYGREVRRTVVRYNEIIADESYHSSRDDKAIK